MHDISSEKDGQIQALEYERDKTSVENKQATHKLKEKWKQKLHECQMARENEVNQLKKEKREIEAIC